MKKKCDYNLIEEIVQGKNIDLLKQHVSECDQCSSRFIAFEALMKNAKEVKLQTVDENIIASIVDKFVAGEKVTKEDLGSLSLKDFIENIYVIQDKQQNNRRVPEYLIDVVRRGMSSEQNRSATIGEIVIKIKNGLHVIENHVKNLFVLPGGEPIMVRSGSVADHQKVDSSVHFYLELNNREKVIYHIVKDKSKGVMMTVQLDSFIVKPAYVNLKESGVLITSAPLKSDYVFFNKLEPGCYEVEIKYSDSRSGYLFPITITED